VTLKEINQNLTSNSYLHMSDSTYKIKEIYIRNPKCLYLNPARRTIKILKK